MSPGRAAFTGTDEVKLMSRFQRWKAVSRGTARRTQSAWILKPYIHGGIDWQSGFLGREISSTLKPASYRKQEIYVLPKRTQNKKTKVTIHNHHPAHKIPWAAGELYILVPTTHVISRCLWGLYPIHQCRPVCPPATPIDYWLELCMKYLARPHTLLVNITYIMYQILSSLLTYHFPFWQTRVRTAVHPNTIWTVSWPTNPSMELQAVQKIMQPVYRRLHSHFAICLWRVHSAAIRHALKTFSWYIHLTPCKRR